MANNTMHHVVIGSNTYEIVDEQGRANVATNTQDITQLKEDLFNVNLGHSLIDYDIIENSYPDKSGNFRPYNNWNRSDYVPVNGGENIYFINPTTYSSDNAFYDSNKSFIKNFSVYSGSPSVVTVPDNARYMVFSNSATSFYEEVYRDLTFTNRYITKEIFNTGKKYFTFLWRQGMIGLNGVQITQGSTDRVYSENFVGGFSSNTVVHIVFNPNTVMGGSVINAKVYDSDLKWVKNLSGIAGLFTFESGYYYRFNLIRANSTITPETADSYVRIYTDNLMHDMDKNIRNLSDGFNNLNEIKFTPKWEQVDNVIVQDGYRWGAGAIPSIITADGMTAIAFDAYPSTLYDVCGRAVGTSSLYAIHFYDEDDNEISTLNNAVQVTVGGEIYHTIFSTPEGCRMVRYSQVTNSNYNSQKAKKYREKGLPDYYYMGNYIGSKIDEINDDSPMNGFQFAFITDLHFGYNEKKSLPLLKNIIEYTPVNVVISGGDYPVAYGDNSELIYARDILSEYSKTLYPNWFSARGNHDFTIRTSSSDTSGVTWDDGLTHSPLIKAMPDWRYEVPTPTVNFLSDKYDIYKNYCWILTNEQEKIKVISFCDMNVTDVSKSFGVTGFVTSVYLNYFAQMLKTTDGYTVVIVTHAPQTTSLEAGASTNATKLIEAFANKTTVTIGAYTHDFRNNTGILACCISGHAHLDQSIKENGVLHINTTCDALYQDDGYGRTAGTTNEQAFDVFSIDTDARTIKAVRVGAGLDRDWTY